MRRSTSRFGLAITPVVSLAVLQFIGCAGSQPEFGEVRGKVTLAGKPLSGVMVTFYPDGEGASGGQFARGKTDSAGNYTLATQTGQQGAVVGKNRVVVNWPTPDRPADWEKGATPKPQGPAIPIKYTTVIDTPLIVEVKAGGPQAIDLSLQQ